MGVRYMKRKTVYSVLVTAILLGALIPLNVQAIDHTLTWHSSLDDEKIAWRIYEQYLFDPADPPTLADRDLYKGSVLAFEINDTLPIYYGDVYEASHPPQFLKLYVDYTEISFYDINDQYEPSFALQFLVIPYMFHNAASGMDENITQFLEHRASTHPNITAIDYFMSGGNYVTVTIYNDFIDSFQITYNNDTGICANLYIEDDFGEMWAQLDIWESSIDDAGVTLDHTLNFHSNLGAGTILAWEYTELTYEPEATGEMEVNNQTLEVGDLFSFHYDAIPTNPIEYYGAEFTGWETSFFDVYYETELMEWEHINRGQIALWLTLINPLSCTLYNDTVIPMDEIHYIRDSNDPGIENTTVTMNGNMLLVYDMMDEYMNWHVELDINTDSGIVETLAIDLIGFVHFEMAFKAANSTLLIDGSVNTDDGDGTTRTLPGFNWFYLFFAVIAVLPIIRRRKC